MAKRIREQLSRGLDNLRPLPASERVPLPVLSELEEPDDSLWRIARELLEMQRARAQTLADADDPRSWFSRIYSIVTERLIAQAEAKQIVHSAWLLRLLPIFERHYSENLAAFHRGSFAELEEHWARAFRVAERARQPKGIAAALFHGIRAHVEGDLGRSLAEVYAHHYAEDVDYVRFRADYLAMNSVFRGAAETMFAEVPRSAIPRWFRFARRALPLGILDLVRDRTFYDMPLQRRRAFADGARIARLLVERRAPASEAV